MLILRKIPRLAGVVDNTLALFFMSKFCPLLVVLTLAIAEGDTITSS